MYEHAKQFAKYLQLAHAGPHEAKGIIETIPRELTAWHDDKIVNVRELLISDALESTTLIQAEMYATVLEGAEPMKCMRDATNVYQMKSNQMTMPYGEAGSYAATIAEGAEIPVYTQTYATRTWTATKKGSRPLITKEMVEDGLYDAVAMEVAKAGARIENRLNGDMVAAYVDGCTTNEYDVAAVASGGTAGAKAIMSAIQMCLADGFFPDTIVAHPNSAAFLYKDFIPAYNTMSQQYVNSGQLPNMLGCKVFQCSPVTTTTCGGTLTWGGPTDGEFGYLVFEKASAGGIGMRRDITVEKYNDPVRDLIGCSVTARYGVSIGAEQAVSRVEMHGA